MGITLVVLGAKLQGMEAIYLGKKAGYHVIVVDKNPDAPGVDLADEYIQADLLKEEEAVPVLSRADVILPAMENVAVIEKLRDYDRFLPRKIIFDWNAHEISRSKEKSNRFFRKIGLALPEKYPDCGYPVILKPGRLSGSEAVKLAYSREEVDAYLSQHPQEEIIIQEYLMGPSYSLEVIGNGNDYYYPQITEVIVDRDYDCKRIVAPAVISEELEEQMYGIGKTLAENLKIQGIFDIEVIEKDGCLKILEIDARIPSQTPISVYHSCGINMVALMAEQALGIQPDVTTKQSKRCCLYQQVVFENDRLEVLGEHVMSECSHLQLKYDFFGADEAITDFTPDSPSWQAIVIITGADTEEAYRKFDAFTDAVRQYVNKSTFSYIEG